MSQHNREDGQLAEKVKAAFQANRCVYGSPRVHAELHAEGAFIVRGIRVARLMREQGLFAKRPRHRTITTKSEPGAQVAPNLLQRDFSADQPNSRMGGRYNVHLDNRRVALSRQLCLMCSLAWWRVWSMATIQDAALVVQALQMAVARRRPQAGLLHHSDRGSTYTSESYQVLLRTAKVCKRV